MALVVVIVPERVLMGENDLVGSPAPDEVIGAKLDRIARGGRVRTLDLFAGCGGLSLGFERAGFDVVGALELDPVAARSHARNFHSSYPTDLLEAHALSRDISVVEPEQLVAELELGEAAPNAVDVVIGGPLASRSRVSGGPSSGRSMRIPGPSLVIPVRTCTCGTWSMSGGSGPLPCSWRTCPTH